MGEVTKKYEVSVCFCPKLAFFGKTVGVDIEKKYEFFQNP
jgi:hypothetical protein